MSEIMKCKICEADFRTSSLKDGKCPICLKNYPNANSKKEAMASKQPKNLMGDDLDETKVRSIVAEMLDKRFNPIVEKLDKALATPEKRPVGRPKKETN